MKLFKSLTPDQRAAAEKISGALVGIFAIFTFVSIVSYLLHWQADMSGEAVSGAAGTLGYKFGRMLVCELFGLGSLAFLVILAAVTVRLLVQKWQASLIKTTLLTLGGAFVMSLILAYVSKLFGLLNLFGGGLGGHCGTFVINWATGVMGPIVVGVILFVLAVCIGMLCSPRFTHWVGKLGTSRAKDPFIDPNAVDVIPGLGDEAAGLDMESEIEPESEPEPEPIPEPVPVDEPEPVFEPVAAEAAPEEIAPEDKEMVVIEGDDHQTKIKKPLPPIDNRLDPIYGLPNYKAPSLELLETYDSGRHSISPEELNRNKNRICATLRNYHIEIADIKAVVGSTVTLYKIIPAPGVRISAIKQVQEDIAMSLNAKGVRVVVLQDCVGIEVANDNPSIVPLRGLLNDDAFRETKAQLPIALGDTITKEVKVVDLVNGPHLLVAGATQQGKSVCLNVIVTSLLYAKHPSELKFVFIDPKMVEFNAYATLLKHYLAVLPAAESEEDEKNHAIVKTAKDAERILRSLCVEMDERYHLLEKAEVNKITLYNEKFKERKLNPENGHKFLPYLVVVVDEYADLTMSAGGSPEAKAAGKSITMSIIRLAQKGRAAGIHVILATQRPSVNVISGIIKSNFPMRIAFRTVSRIDSTTILDAPGAEKLIGRGDMLFSSGIDNERIQCGLVEGKEISRITQFIGSQTRFGECYNTPYYLPIPADNESEGGGGARGEVGDLDERFEEAARLVVTTQKASTSYLQTRLAMGFAKAARVMSQLEVAGIIGPQDGAKPRQVLISDPAELDRILDECK